MQNFLSRRWLKPPFGARLIVAAAFILTLSAANAPAVELFKNASLATRSFGWKATKPVQADYDGDGKADLAVYHPGPGRWYIQQSSEGHREQQFGWSKPIPVPRDYDGDGRADIALYHNGTWSILQSTDGFRKESYGWGGTDPVPANYLGADGAELAVRDPVTSIWYIKSQSPRQYGWRGPIAVPADYDGDGYAQLAIFDPSKAEWWRDGMPSPVKFGWPGPTCVHADYDGDGHVDIALYDPVARKWYIRASSDGSTTVKHFNWPGEPVPADYDGDEKADIAVYDAGTWRILLSDGRSTHTEWETGATPEIRAMARALQNDPKLIYEYVRNHIEYVPTHGMVNGAHGSLLAGRGNDWDQSALLCSLLRVAGYDTRLVYADVDYAGQVLRDWFGSNNVAKMLREGGNNESSYLGGDKYRMKRLWVEARIDDTWYTFDPAHKAYEDVEGLDLKSAMGYVQSELLNSAKSGASVTSQHAQNLNRSKVRAKLGEYAANLMAAIKAEKPNATLTEILGGRRLVEETLSEYVTALPKKLAVHNAKYWENVPAAHNLTFRVRYPEQSPGIDKTFKGYELAGKRLTIFFDDKDSYRPILRLAGKTVATGKPTTPGRVLDLRLEIDHPHIFGMTDGHKILKVTSGPPCLIIHDFGGSSDRTLEDHGRDLSRNVDAGQELHTESVLGPSMEMVAGGFYHESHLAQDLLSKATIGGASYRLHSYGSLELNDGYEIDWPGNLIAVFPTPYSDAERINAMKAFGLFGSVLEHGILEQHQGSEGECVSTVKLLGINNQRGKKTFLVDSVGDWNAVRPQLQGYRPGTLNDIGHNVGRGYTYLLPQDGNLSVNEWSGYAYIISKVSPGAALAFGPMIGGNAGGFSTLKADWIFDRSYFDQPNSWDPWGSFKNMFAPLYNPWRPNVFRSFTFEPVDVQTGDYYLESTDLTLGRAEPRGLKFIRRYNSSRNLELSPLGYGWSHNYEISIRESSHVAPGLGVGNPLSTVPFLVYSVVATDLIANDTDVVSWLTASFAAKWIMDQLTDNAVVVESGNGALEFIRMPDGSYVGPKGSTATLTKSGSQFILQKRLGETLTFNDKGKISEWRNADGNKLAFTYDSEATKLLTATDAYGRTLTFGYHGDRIGSVSDSTGRTVSYGYDGKGHLVTYTDPEANRWTYKYNADGDHRMTAHHDPEGRLIARTRYDELGHAKTQTDANGNITKFYISGHRNVEEDPIGAQTVHYFDKDGRSLGTEIEGLNNRNYRYYDGQGYLVRSVDPRGAETKYRYDGRHNRIKTIDALDQEAIVGYDDEDRIESVTDAAKNTTSYVYDHKHHLTVATDALGRQTVKTYYGSGLLKSITDPAGGTISFTYDSYGNPKSTHLPDGGVIRHTYNARGDLLSQTDPNGHTTHYVYDKRRLLTATTDPLGNTVSVTYDGAGLKVSSMDAERNTTHYTYTPSQKLDTVTYPDPDPDGATVKHQYNSRDLLESVTDPLGRTTKTLYDLARRVEKVFDPRGKETTYAYDLNGNLRTVTDPLKRTTTFDFDELNRQRGVTDPLQHKATQEYNALSQLKATTDAKGYRTRYFYDALGAHTNTIMADGTREQFVYDNVGRPVRFINGAGAVRSFEYDEMGRVETEVTAAGDRTAYEYYPAGRLWKRTFPDWQQTEYFYDEIGQLTQIDYPDGSDVRFEYYADGQLRKMVDEIGRTDYVYDKMNRLEKITGPHFGNVVEYTYYTDGNRETTTYPGGLTVTYGYDDAGRLKSVTDWRQRVTTYHYYDDGTVKGISYPNGVEAVFVYDDATRLESFGYAKGSDFAARSFDLDPVGNKLREEIISGLSPSMARAVVRRHAQDQADELTLVSEKPDPASPTWTDYSCTYDARGNLETYGADLSASYDSDNRATRIESGRSVTHYEYDGLGNRVKRTIDGVSRIDVLDHASAAPRVLVEQDDSGAPLFYYIWGIHLIARIDAQSDEVLYYHQDERGSTLALTDAGGSIVREYSYDPYGAVAATSGSPKGNRFTFAGGLGITDEGNGTYYMQARYYHAGLKRFLSADPAGLTGGANLYAYANGNPIGFVDPSGLGAESASSSWGGRAYNPIIDNVTYVGDREAAVQSAQTTLDVVGIFFDAADAVNAVIYLYKGDYKNAALSAVACIPLAGDLIAKGAKWALHANDMVKVTRTIVRVADKAEDVMSIGRHATRHGSRIGGELLSVPKAPKRTPPTLARSGDDLFVGTYSQVRSGNIRSGLSSTHTPHHSVQAAVSPASSRSAGVSINLRKDLHAQTRTFRKPVVPALNLRTHLSRDVRDVRAILRDAGYEQATINRQLQELIRQNKSLGGLNK